MTKSLLILFNFLIGFNVFAQQFYIPNRVGDKFGLVDNNGTSVIKPQFDILEIEPVSFDYFKGYNLIGGEMLSNIIHRDNIIIKNQKYSKYDLSEIIIRAHRYLVNGNQITEKQNLFNSDGVKLFENDLHSVEVIFPKNIDRNRAEDLLVISIDESKNYTIQIFNVSSKKFSNKLLSNIKIETSYPFEKNDNEIVFNYLTKSGESKRLTVKDIGTSFQMISDEKRDVEIIEKETAIVNLGNDIRVAQNSKAYSKTNASLEIEKSQSNQLILNEVLINNLFYLPKKADSLSFKQYTQDKVYLFSQNGKKGIKNKKSNDILIPAEFDEIFKMYEQPNTYIVKKDNLYGIIIPRNSVYISPTFTYFPYLDRSNFGKSGFMIIKLFDDKGNFFCYADQTGKMYYSE